MTTSANLQFKLRDTANFAIWKGAHQSYPNGLPFNEVACLRNLIERGIPLIQKVWAEILGSIGITVHLSGVICHGRPYVRFGGYQRGCELGDFLLVHDHQPNYGVAERRAVIVQSKVFYDNGGVKQSSRNLLQLELYRDWPRFRYTSWPGGLPSLKAIMSQHGLLSSSLNPFERDLAIVGPFGTPSDTPASIDSGCCYGMIEMDFLQSYWTTNYRRNPWRLCSPHAPPLVYTSRHGFKLGTYLARLIRGDAGRATTSIGWPTDLASACHWSLMVNELLSLQASSATKTLRSLGAAATRRASGQSNEYNYGTKIASEGPDKPATQGATEGEESGFAVIVVSTSGDLLERRGPIERE